MTTPKYTTIFEVMAAEAELRRAEHPWRSTLGGVIVLADDEFHQLFGGAAVVWEQLDEPLSVEAIVSALPESTPTIESEVRATVDMLLDRGLLERVA